jgi:hypothetical protein|tara:strand:- start:163 stop:450 length:288 start_codon:yes stop_codon:yes gene_type:complete
MKEGDIVVIDATIDVLIHARLRRPLVSGWVVELVCDNGVEHMKKLGHPAFSGYCLWMHADKIGYEYGHSDKVLASCDGRCVFEEESELYKTYGGD